MDQASEQLFFLKDALCRALGVIIRKVFWQKRKNYTQPISVFCAVHVLKPARIKQSEWSKGA